ncbi:hypothetical protein [Bosea thiooxidans]
MALLLLRYPERRFAILRVALTPTMAELCEPYELACVAAKYWAEVPGSEAAAMTAEFRLLIGALEAEVSRELSE